MEGLACFCNLENYYARIEGIHGKMLNAWGELFVGDLSLVVDYVTLRAHGNNLWCKQEALISL
jgi:hypothetical protein